MGAHDPILDDERPAGPSNQAAQWGLGAFLAGVVGMAFLLFGWMRVPGLGLGEVLTALLLLFGVGALLSAAGLRGTGSRHLARSALVANLVFAVMVAFLLLARG
jgi:hypothetical protein